MIASLPLFHRVAGRPVVVGAVYLAGLYLGRGRAGLAMPEMSSIDAELDRQAGGE